MQVLAIPRRPASGSALLIVAALAACASPPKLVSGNATLQLSADKTTLTFSRGSESLLTFHSSSFQLGTVDSLTTGGNSFDPYWLVADMPPAPPGGLQFRQVPSGGAMKLVSLSKTQMVIEVDYTGAKSTVTFTADAPDRLSAVLVPSITDTQSVAYIRLRPDADPTEGFYGLGEWGDSVNHRGKLRPMQMELDGALESGDDENHTPVPLLIGTRGWGLFVESRRPGAFDIARATSTDVEVTFGTADQSAAGLAFHLFSEPQPMDILKHYFDITGYPRLPATWALGPMMWRDENTGQGQVLDDINEIRTVHHLATSGMWFDRPYASGVETFDFSPLKFADPPTMLKALHDSGFRYGLWQTPYAAPAGVQDPAPTENAYATENGFFPPVTGVLTNKWGKPIDFTNPAAYAWFQTNLKNYTNPLDSGGFGVQGWKLDYGEDVVVGAFGVVTPWKFFDGSDEFTMHYGYTLLYHQMYSQLLPSEGGFFLCRTGRWGDQVHGMIIWPGDLDGTFAQQGDPLPPGSNGAAVGGLPAALMKGISLSASGFPFYASDTGGYRSEANNETWVRWVEANTIATAMEVGDAAEVPWYFTTANGRTQESLDDYQMYALLHMRLFPYEWSYAQSMATTGRPILRPFGFAYPVVGEHPNDEYLFGDFILSAPVVAAGLTSRDVILPPGTWIGWWDGQAHDGGPSGAHITAPADLDTLPLYLAAGGIVPMLRDTIETLSPVAAGSTTDSFATTAGVLWVRVAPSASATSFPLYDGSAISQQVKGGSLSLAFKPGSSAVFTQGALFEVIATPAAPTSVSSNAATLTMYSSKADLQGASDGWFWESATGGTLWIKVAGEASVTVH